MHRVRSEALKPVALDVRETSHMSAGMLAYVRKLRTWLPRVAPDLTIVDVGRGDNFDFAEQVGLPLACLEARAGLVHICSQYVPRFLPVPYVVTVHDLIDLEFPQYGKKKVGPYYQAIVGPVLRAARAVITDDEATVPLLRRFAGVDPARVRVVPLGVDDPAGDVEPIVHPRPYLLYVGNHRPHKNLATLTAAWAALPPELDVDLVMTGDADMLEAQTRERGRIVLLGHLPDPDLRRWYAGAAAYVHPALREGFGLPMLEAMRAGTRVIAARSSVPSVLAAHAILFDATDVTALRVAMLAALHDPAAFAAAGRAAREATRDLTWQRTARLTADVYRSVLA